MDSRSAAAPQASDPDAVEFVRFCYGRRRVGWPELYDEMCGVAGRGLYRGYGADELAEIGIGFSLFEMGVLAALTRQVIAEEQARRRPVAVRIHIAEADDVAAGEGPSGDRAGDDGSNAALTSASDSDRTESAAPRRLVAVGSVA